ncbi:hypothetical protein [Dorea sp. D27]|uniref:hypothetical protein n=1 Tax=Dorea sp. D27 TaxID=658665 RepID=UPI000673C4A8|nr:hypothetical protein [Dorea sp. D27]KMZ53599.1 hypothetical protein HMPREF0980_02468 [Dorea sp. D27]
MKRYKVDGTFSVMPGTETGRVFLPVTDSMEKNTMWGRLHTRMRLPEKGLCHIYTLAGNDREEIEQLLRCTEAGPDKKAGLFYTYGRKAGTNSEDVLLYDMRGRYLWIYIEVAGPGRAVLDNIFIENPGDEFMQMFPEVYQEPGGFFQRYLSVLSTLYRDMQKKIDESASLLDEETADRELVRLYTRWLGFDGARLGLSEKEERMLLMNLYWLNRRKGTKEAVLRLCDIFMEAGPNVMEVGKEELFLAFERQADADRNKKFARILGRFLPAGLRVRIVCGKEPACCDGHMYLDVNGVIAPFPEGALDTGEQCGKCVGV